MTRKVKWNGYTIEELEMTEELSNQIFAKGGYTLRVDGTFPNEVADLPQGYYRIVEVDQYFEIENYTTEWGSTVHKFSIGFGTSNVIVDYVDAVATAENERKYQEVFSKHNAEENAFNQDMETELVFVDGVAKMNNYCNKSIEVHYDENDGSYDLYLNGEHEVNILTDVNEAEFTTYDGLDIFGWYNSIKKAVKAYMDAKYSYINPYAEDDIDYVASCSNCGDGGCMHCEPHLFL